MPFKAVPKPLKKIAVIGAGISGMGAAHMLAQSHHVTLIEAEHRLGGHARTIMAGKRGDQPVDTGFIVFNYANYPHLAALFAQLDVPVVKSNMSFAASLNGGGMEYALNSLDTLFAQRKNLLNPRYLRMIRDILHFNKNALRLSQTDPEMTIAGLLQRLGTGSYFRDYYLLPFSGAIWSTPTEQIMEFPAYAMMKFFDNHALLNHTGQHQWYTVQGGSRSYVTRLEAAMRARGVDIRLGAPVQAVRRHPAGAEVKLQGAEWEDLDEVVFATHSDDSLRMLADPTAEESAALGASAYQPNDIVLHADPTIMPKRRKVWANWNYTEQADKSLDRIDLTYWMNSLQPIPHDDPHFVTLNSTRPINEALIYDQVTLRHPVYDVAALAAQKQVQGFNGRNRTWFCGAWMKNGFHEDGLGSAVDVAERLNAMGNPQAVAA